MIVSTIERRSNALKPNRSTRFKSLFSDTGADDLVFDTVNDNHRDSHGDSHGESRGESHSESKSDGSSDKSSVEVDIESVTAAATPRASSHSKKRSRDDVARHAQRGHHGGATTRFSSGLVSPSHFVAMSQGAPNRFIPFGTLSTLDDEFRSLEYEKQLLPWLDKVKIACGITTFSGATVDAVRKALYEANPRVKRSRAESTLLTAKMTPSKRQMEMTVDRIRVDEDAGFFGVKILPHSCKLVSGVWLICGAQPSMTSPVRIRLITPLDHRASTPRISKDIAVPRSIVCSDEFNACIVGSQMLIGTTLREGYRATYVADINTLALSDADSDTAAVMSADAVQHRARSAWGIPPISFPHGCFTEPIKSPDGDDAVLLFASKGDVFLITATSNTAADDMTMPLASLTMTRVSTHHASLGKAFMDYDMVESTFVDKRSTAECVYIHAATRSALGVPSVHTFKFEWPGKLHIVNCAPGLSKTRVTSLVCTNSSMHFADAGGMVRSVDITDGLYTTMSASSEAPTTTAIRFQSSPDLPCAESLVLYQYSCGVMFVTTIVPRFVRELIMPKM